MGKKMHLTCPKCHYDLEYNEDYVERNIEQLGSEIHNIDRQLQEFKAKNPFGYKKDTWYRNAVRAKAIKTEQLAELKKHRKAAYARRDMQLYYALKAKLKKELGEERYTKMMEELEEELYYNPYDMAKQTYNTFQGM